jgi:hypothetical protein
VERDTDVVMRVRPRAGETVCALWWCLVYGLDRVGARTVRDTPL